ncbi:MAG: PilZ domain-containing protein [Acidobacteria bacterium]|nr:PilZ domain-containing protein [Acidobacteriota bacterium]
MLPRRLPVGQPLARPGQAAYHPRAPMAEPYATPRRFPRVKMLGNVTGEVSFLQDVTLLDLSEGGARLEHAGRFALNAICFLRVPVPEGDLLKAWVVHSAVSRTVPGTGGEPTLLFQSGVEFVGLTLATLLPLRQFLASVDRPPGPA